MYRGQWSIIQQSNFVPSRMEDYVFVRRPRACSQERTLPLLSLLDFDALVGRFHVVAFLLYLDRGIDGQLKDFLDALVFLGAAFDVLCAHSLRNCLSLLGCDWGETLGAQEFDAGSFGPKVRLQTNEDERCGRAEM